jgi:hypothetical protein
MTSSSNLPLAPPVSFLVAAGIPVLRLLCLLRIVSTSNCLLEDENFASLKDGIICFPFV